ncbi:hypothetical protein GALMADRAFT_223054 [Galerina marginata CBS 339.88]|uniref:Uncharacterized protein n=1 Tax=Galerina marginata (strain CBS 339.88) TaxID=685588 RepID=A0A067TJR3_GALM3|nr:hypothetical protein GALMADRAFT_223054 [Galerina marginata CBS 339.88]
MVGHLEMKSLSSSTGGVTLLSDSFATFLFKQSFTWMFDKDYTPFRLKIQWLDNHRTKGDSCLLGLLFPRQRNLDMSERPK